MFNAGAVYIGTRINISSPFRESNDTRGCNNIICPPEDEQGTARNMSRIIM